MLYFDYSWDLSENRIILDEELNIDRLGWRSGDLFKVTNIDGRAQLIKVDPLEKFVRGHGPSVIGIVNEEDDTVQFVNAPTPQDTFNILKRK
jgi:hypothetical protein